MHVSYKHFITRMYGENYFSWTIKYFFSLLTNYCKSGGCECKTIWYFFFNEIFSFLSVSFLPPAFPGGTNTVFCYTHLSLSLPLSNRENLGFSASNGAPSSILWVNLVFVEFLWHMFHVCYAFIIFYGTYLESMSLLRRIVTLNLFKNRA